MKDIQNLYDSRNIVIQKAGVKNVRLPFMILEKNGGYQQVCADISLSADLAANIKGTHMSRFIQLLNKWSCRQMSGSAIKEILSETREELDAKRADLSMYFSYFIKKIAPVSGFEGFIDFKCGFKGIYEDAFKFFLSSEIPLATVCPCSKEISDYGAHNQRALVRVNISYERSEHVWIEDLVDGISRLGSIELYPVLKRPDEKHVTEKGYDNPKFVEDVVRDVVIYLEKIDGLTSYEVECEAMESIHSHNAFAYAAKGC